MVKDRNGTSVRFVLALAGAAAAMAQVGCEVDSFFDPARTGYFEHMPTTIPILDRIDVIEPERTAFGRTSAVVPEDLVPGDLEYTLAPGDVLTVQIFQLYAANEWHASTRRINAGGFFRLPELGDVQAAGLTPQEFENGIVRLLHEQVVRDPLVDITVEDSGGFQYVVDGAVRATGVYRLNRPDLRLLGALAMAGGVPQTTEKVFVIRQVELTSDVLPSYLRPPEHGAETPQPQPQRPSIEDLIDDLEPGAGGAGGGGGVNPGVFQEERPPLVDVDQLEPVLAQPRQGGAPQSAPAQKPPVQDIPGAPSPEDTFIYDEQRDEWVRVRAERAAAAPETVAGDPPMVLERVIEIPFQRLKSGDSSLNVVVRPDDRVYVEEPPAGLVYLEGEVLRPGTYNMPLTGRLTLSRLIAAAGGLGPLAVPERVDLTRIVGDSREATLRMNLKAIRSRNEPDVYLQPDDHIIVGTNFWATPLAIIRSGFRATYGFGFLLDRNFGNDVFGPPPVEVN